MSYKDKSNWLIDFTYIAISEKWKEINFSLENSHKIFKIPHILCYAAPLAKYHHKHVNCSFVTNGIELNVNVGIIIAYIKWYIHGWYGLRKMGVY